ncbi:transmembrane ATPase [Micractinium conductrix]|uniref:V-type proton ATPase subunit G n=1 Tax=Micractinium conductrix TaxID=554055 RepID=A0A2P6V8H6_9CHLO|nr:transmembrane ATPase [Micractinium conductrix]|eukprot:PSC70388.1 transmembrane ATPase [Micractinium conductrix]
MEVPAGQDGIQRLLAAEQEAQAIVAKARKAKSDRLKQAKEEAEREIAAFKAEREADFKRKVNDHGSSSQDNVVRLAEQSSKAVQGIQESIGQKKKHVLDLLMHHVTEVKLVKY